MMGRSSRRRGGSGEAIEVVLDVQRWAHGGDAIGRPEEGPLAGVIVFVAGVCPGDRIRARIRKRKKRWARAELIEVLRPGAGRRDAPCPHQAACGGCPWMIGDRATQDASRLSILRGEVTKRLGLSPEDTAQRVHLAPRRPEERELGYRSRLRLAFDTHSHEGVRLGFRRAGSHSLVDIQTCLVASPALRAALPEVRAAIAGRLPPGASGEVRLLHGEEGVAVRIEPRGAAPVALGPDTVTVRVGSAALRVGPGDFVQANGAVATAIAAEIEAIARAAGPGQATELFAGSGTFTVPLITAGWSVTAYELAGNARSAFEAATRGRGEATFHVADLLDSGVPIPAPPPPGLVLIDAPRSGALEIMPWIRASGARTLILVSCDVATGLRDAAALLEDGRYRLDRLLGYDMFPHTGHQELLMVLGAT